MRCTYSNHISFTVSAIPRVVKIPHGHRVHRGAIIRSHRSASRWYNQRSRRPSIFVLNFYNTGVLADNSKSRFGRRRPFMIGGAIITAVATILFGFTRPVAAVFSEEGSRLVCAPGMCVGGTILIVRIVRGSVNMARHIRHLRHGFLNKCRYVWTPDVFHQPTRSSPICSSSR